MATKTINVGHTVEDKSYILGVVSQRPPFKTPVAFLSEEYALGTDFSSGDTVNIVVYGTSKIRFAMFTEDSGEPINYSETTPSAGAKQLSFTAPNSNVKSLIVYDT